MLRSFPLVGAAAAAPTGPGALEPSSDAALVAAAIGDADAFRPLYDRYLPPMLRYLSARTGSPDLAAELTQAAMVQAWSRLETYRADRGSFSSWLFAIARNLAANERRRPLPVAWETVGDSLEDPALDPHSAAEASERRARLLAVIARLDRGKQDLLALRYAAGLSCPEIAPIVGKNPEAVKKQLSRTLALIREKYGEELVR